jgi:drug/metabolite transporter (DMT)-like permease
LLEVACSVLTRAACAPAQLLGIALALGGSVAMADPGASSSSASASASALAASSDADGVPRATFLRGAALLAASPAAWATSLYLQKPLLRVYPPFTLTAWTFAAGTAAMAALAAGLYHGQPDAWRLGPHEGQALVAAVLVGWCVMRLRLGLRLRLGVRCEIRLRLVLCVRAAAVYSSSAPSAG